MPRKIYLIFSLFLICINFNSKTITEDIESKEKRSNIIFDRFVQYISAYKELQANEIMIHTAKFFIGSPYVASTLEQQEGERLVVNLVEFDCTTFVETCMALTLTTISDELTFERFKENLQLIRYRQGIIDGYSSRLHYMTDWISDGESKRLFKNISKNLGGTPKKKQINFMSTHPDSYFMLRNNKTEIDKIADIETHILSENYVVIPKEKILGVGNAVLNGDITIFATAIDGLDYSHVGLAYKENNVLKMIHASSTSRKVVIENRSIDMYCKAIRSCTGITILRMVDTM